MVCLEHHDWAICVAICGGTDRLAVVAGTIDRAFDSHCFVVCGFVRLLHPGLKCYWWLELGNDRSGRVVRCELPRLADTLIHAKYRPDGRAPWHRPLRGA